MSFSCCARESEQVRILGGQAIEKVNLFESGANGCDRALVH